MDDKLLSLAFSVEAGKGEYALLLGSGLSSSAGIPTGWEILTELCRERMILEKQNSEKDPIIWYKNKYKKEPLYDEVIKKLAQTPTDRNNLLREFFEPTNEDKKEGRKIPTEAHHAIAKMVQQGYIKVIVTTNFDNLIEKALDDLSIPFQTLYHDSDIKGLKPLTHSKCTVLKIHGDYRDTRFKNISNELNNYSGPLTKLLKQIFDEYGMIVSGWSAEWDTALRDTITSVRSRRYSWYWHAFTEELKNEAERLIKFRDGNKIVDTAGAEHFFKELKDSVSAIAKNKRVNPENSQVIVTRFKKYISNNREIDVNDMILKYTQEITSYLEQQEYQGESSNNKDILWDRVKEIKEKCNTLAMLSAILAYYGKTNDHKHLLFQTLERLTDIERKNGDSPRLLALQHIPLQVILYSIGISTVMRKNYKFLYQIFNNPKLRNRWYNHYTFLKYTSPYMGLQPLFKYLDTKDYLLPLESIFINPYMKDIFINAHLALNETEFDIHYDIFEFLRAIVYRCSQEKNGYFSGLFGIKDEEKRQHINQLLKDAATIENSPVLDVCNGNKQTFHEALQLLVKDLHTWPFIHDGLLIAYEDNH